MSYYEQNIPDNYENEKNLNRRKQVRKKKKSGLLFGDFVSKGKFSMFPFLMVIGLSVIGLMMILSSSYYKAIQQYGDGLHFFKRQLLFFIIGIIVMYIVSKINFRIYKKVVAFGIYVVSMILLIIVLFKGDTFGGAQRWLEIGPLSFQPSELAKIAMILLLALMLAGRKNEVDLNKISFHEKLWKSIDSYRAELIVIAIPTLLIGIENLSTAAVVLFTGLCMLFIDGFKLETWMIILLCLLGVGILFIKVGGIDLVQSWDIAGGKYNRRLQRLETWLDPFSDPLDGGYQTVQCLYAIGSGGIAGVGLGKSKQKLGYIPESYNDMIFPIICEEFGLVGAIFIIILFISLITNLVNISMNSQDRFAKFFTIGYTSLISLQVLVNVGVVTGVIPNTGMPLPFISYGGTTLLILLAGMGIVLNISRYQE